jgi:two-component system, response regulator PdtaR
MADITILIVEDEPLIAEDLAGILKKLDFEIQAVCYTLQDAQKQLSQKNKPDLVLLDINLNGEESGIEIGKWLNEELLVPFVYVSSYSDSSTVRAASQTQPSGYIVKPFTQAAIYSAVEIALYNHAQKIKQLFPKLSLEKLNRKLIEPITDREFDVIELLNDGKTNTQISEQLFISLNTTKKHIKNIFVKLGVSSRSSLIAAARNLMSA